MSSAQLAHDVIQSWRAGSHPQHDLLGRRRELGAIGPVTTIPATAGETAAQDAVPTRPHDLLGALRRRRSTRFFDERPVPADQLFDLVAGGLAGERDSRAEPDDSLPPIETTAVVFRVEGLSPGLHTLDPTARSARAVAPLPGGAQLHELTLQSEFCGAAVILSLGADLATATAREGSHGYRLLMQRASYAAYSMWVDGVGRGWTGSVFAGLLPAALRQPLGSDGASRHQLFALALGMPSFDAPVAPISPAPAEAGAGATTPYPNE